MTHVLVVDDSETVSEFLRWAFTTDHHAVTIAGAHKERLLNADDPRWHGVTHLVCDLVMPEVDGLDVLRAAQRHHPHIKRICLTGLDDYDSPDLLKAARRVSDRVLPKPSELDDILAAVAGG